MNNKHQVLLLWDIGEGADLYALTVTPDEFKDLMSINGLFSGADLPQDLEPTWDRVYAALTYDQGKWTGNKLETGAVVTLNGDWTVVSSGMVP